MTRDVIQPCSFLASQRPADRAQARAKARASQQGKGRCGEGTERGDAVAWVRGVMWVLLMEGMRQGVQRGCSQAGR